MIDELREAIVASFSKLIENDGYLFDCPIEEYFEYDSRKLHEVCINHRLAVYLEEFILPLLNGDDEQYFVDIEFNREGINKKNLKVGDEKTVRPDIIIHNRKSGEEKKNFLIVECKKSGASNGDIEDDRNRVKAFLENERYKYSYGLQVIYTRQLIDGTLFYKSDEAIEEIKIRNR